MILVDEARWPAHGTTFAHLVSDASLDELHDFAAAIGLDPRAFDHDHYDLPASLLDAAVRRGAAAVRSTELVRRLVGSGLRVRSAQRTPGREAAERSARAWWDARWPGEPALAGELLQRWTEPHRHYHDVRHLASILGALDELGCDDVAVGLAAWFHDAVYEPSPSDEHASAELATELLAGTSLADHASEVARLVRLTATHDPAGDDAAGQSLCDADLSILGSVAGRYHVYLRDVRLDYAHVDDDTFVEGRHAVVENLLARVSLFSTAVGRRLWADRARHNLGAELRGFTAGGGYPWGLLAIHRHAPGR